MTYSNEYMWVKGFVSGKKLQRSTKAMGFMYQAHYGQMRNDGACYYEHPVKVANYLLELDVIDDLDQLDILICCAILHDILEDTKITYDIIVREFGDEVASRVKILSKEKGDDLKEYFKNVQIDLITALIKCSDRVHNLSTAIGTFKPERLQRYVNETEEYIIPIAKYLREVYPDIGGKMCIINFQLKSSLHAAVEYLKIVENKTE